MMVHTHYSYSYNSKEALDIAFVSLDPSCTRKVQENIGSDHLPILIELKKRQSVWVNNKKLWNFRRVDWLSFTTFMDNEISRNPLTEDLDTNWNTLKKVMHKVAKYNIPRGKMKKRPYLTNNSPSLQPLLEERKQIVDVLNSNNSNQDRIELHEVNAELKRKYAQIKRNKWNELCTSLDSRSSNGKLWKLVKNIGKEQPQVEKCNTIKNRDGTVAWDDGQAANILGSHYQNNINKLTFKAEDKHIRSRASDIVHGCCSNTQESIPIFNWDLTLQELEAAIADSKLNKSPGPDGIHGQMMNKLGSVGRLRCLDIINGSWKIGRLPRDWRRTIVIPIGNP
ncbi:hypothetical protein AVEN_204636-1 [Araneus ventricosus]|uniref:Endonuclease/exonuclease/phosphatase domain-containing protein n=1 Tax=Araneus ventricosus TaxID=182803 RepID=A0A4Y2T8E3_ARAVE|nr:hypothetical protein AVEN_204636-1 [Araneus ventricosus]